MSFTRIFRLGLTLATCAVLGMALPGCQDALGFRQIPSEFTGPYVGTMAPPDAGIAVRVDTIVTEAAIKATIHIDGSVIFDVTSIEGEFTATGGINTNNQLSATGTLNGNTVDFTGTWTTNGFGHAAGTWRNVQTGITGSWSIAQQGVSNSSLATAYFGTFTEGTISGNLSFSIGTDGSISGTATGFGIAETVSLTGGINFEDLIVMTGSYNGAPVFFIGTLEVATRTVTGGFAASGVNGGSIGSWSAAVD